MNIFWMQNSECRMQNEFYWWRWWDSNPWPPACRAGALPAERHPHKGCRVSPISKPLACLVGPSGLEPPTSCLSGTRSNLLSYEPMWLVWLFTLGLQCREQISLLSHCVGIELSSRTVSHKVSSPLQSLTSVFGMGTGGPSAFITPTIYLFKNLWSLKIEQQLFSLHSESPSCFVLYSICRLRSTVVWRATRSP